MVALTSHQSTSSILTELKQLLDTQTKLFRKRHSKDYNIKQQEKKWIEQIMIKTMILTSPINENVTIKNSIVFVLKF